MASCIKWCNYVCGRFIQMGFIWYARVVWARVRFQYVLVLWDLERREERWGNGASRDTLSQEKSQTQVFCFLRLVFIWWACWSVAWRMFLSEWVIKFSYLTNDIMLKTLLHLKHVKAMFIVLLFLKLLTSAPLPSRTVDESRTHKMEGSLWEYQKLMNETVRFGEGEKQNKPARIQCPRWRRLGPFCAHQPKWSARQPFGMIHAHAHETVK